MKALLGKKIGMTQIINDDGAMVPVTLIHVGENTITGVRTEETDGYTAVQLGYGEAKHMKKPQADGLKKNNVKSQPKFIREVRDMELSEESSVGGSFNAGIFEIGDKVKVTGTSKGKGWAGTVKRHNFNTSKRTHGGNGYVRRPGSIGSMYPQKVFKGKRMAGRMGGETTTTLNLKVAYVDEKNQLVGIKGAVPGPKRGHVVIRGIA
ncbi:TPA: 50S ribosomal protein L3 [Candidatus Saccharibacteria bacterium]|nr:50S ribosomal protein L3 [Candidatus Saccharibacteria bacterium]HIO87400.1 50S ribosomal protein L3 [Candidatus Saccharibacteria bacterium]